MFLLANSHLVNSGQEMCSEYIQYCIYILYVGGYLALECADKLVKWGVVPGGTLKHSVIVFLPSHIIILPSLFCS